MQTAKITAFVFSLALVTSACGDSMSSLNPTAPSSLSPDSLNVEAGGAAPAAGSMAKPPKPGNGNGNGNGNGSGNGNGNGNDNRVQPRSAEWSRVQFEGLIKTVGADSITVSNQLVKVLADTVIRKGDVRFQLAALRAGDRVHVTAWRMQGNPAVEASEIKLQNPGEGEAEGEEPPPAPSGSVSVDAPDNAASESGNDNGVFLLTRTGNDEFMALSLTVNFSLSGAAVNGTDYESLPVSVVFGPAQATAELTVTPRADSLVEGSEAVVLTLTADPSYDLGVPASATVTIADQPPPPAGTAVSVAAENSRVTQMFGMGAFVLTRSGDVSAPLTVTISLGGTAANEFDYTFIASTVTFAAGQSTARVEMVMNFDEDMVEETIVVTVLGGPNYNPGSPASATITIVP